MDIIATLFLVYSGVVCLQKFLLLRIIFMPDNIITLDEKQTPGEIRFSEKFLLLPTYSTK